ncbi:MAG TPA: hypothetical protein VF841_04900 [Anaeromyxobacter sp.]
MLLLAATALLSAALAGVDGTAVDLQTSGRTETSALAFSAGGAPVRGLAAVDVLPRVALALDHRTLRLTLAYEPQLRLSQALSYPTTDATMAQGASARGEWELDPLWRATGTARSSIRILDFVAPGGGDLSRLLDLRHAPPVFRYREDAASAGLEGRPTHLLTVGVTVAVDSTGGVGADGAAAVPGMRELRVGGSVARAQTSIDELKLEASGATAAFDLGGAAALGTISAGWARQAARVLRVHVSASASDARDADGASRVLAGGELGLEGMPALFGRPLTLSASVRAGPAFDRFAAGVLERAGVNAAAMWAATPRWSFGGIGMYGRVLDRLGYSAGRGDVRAEWKASRRLTLYGDVWHERHLDPAAVNGAAAYTGTSVGVVLAPLAR